MIFIPEGIKPPGGLLAFPKFEGVVAWPYMARGNMAAGTMTPHFTKKDTSEGLLDGPPYCSRYMTRDVLGQSSKLQCWVALIHGLCVIFVAPVIRGAHRT